MKQKIIKQVNYWGGVVVIGLILGVSLQFVRAWTEPTVAPPGGNVGAPINTSDNPQIKQAGMALNVAGHFANGLLVPNGNVGIGTVLPGAKLEVNGNAIADTPMAGNHLATRDYVDAAGGGGQLTECYVKCANNNNASCNFGFTRIFLFGGGAGNGCYNGPNIYTGHLMSYHGMSLVCDVHAPPTGGAVRFEECKIDVGNFSSLGADAFSLSVKDASDEVICNNHLTMYAGLLPSSCAICCK